jgi:hypothetical protein
MIRLAPGIMVMQAVTIFFPIYETYKSRTEARNILSILKEWEEKRDANAIDSNFEKLKESSESSTESGRSIEMYGMAALKNVLATDPHALLQFAATKDFTAENIVFLLELQTWRTAWENESQKLTALPTQTKAQLFHMAVEIYAEFVSEKTAEFPINIEGPIRARLDAVFQPSVIMTNRRSNENVAFPWNEAPPVNISEVETSKQYSGIASIRETDSSFSETLTSDSIEDRDGIPTSIKSESNCSIEYVDVHIFDAAEKSIKYLVLTNTWRKFVDEIREQKPQSLNETLR